jgi:rare lipoprotein A (peptidoglycan hydrolase)
MRRTVALALAGPALVAPASSHADHPDRCRTHDCLVRTCRSSACHRRVARRLARRRPSSPAVTASWYGPGLYGHPLGCSGYGTLQPGTAGVANRTLPCGSTVRLCVASSTGCAGPVVTTHVIDRGPYVAGRTFDLTVPVRDAVGLRGVGAVRYAVGG